MADWPEPARLGHLRRQMVRSITIVTTPGSSACATLLGARAKGQVLDRRLRLDQAEGLVRGKYAAVDCIRLTSAHFR